MYRGRNASRVQLHLHLPLVYLFFQWSYYTKPLVFYLVTLSLIKLSHNGKFPPFPFYVKLVVHSPHTFSLKQTIEKDTSPTNHSSALWSVCRLKIESAWSLVVHCITPNARNSVMVSVSWPLLRTTRGAWDISRFCFLLQIFLVFYICIISIFWFSVG